VERKLAAILAADVVGYSRLMEADEEGTFAALQEIRSNRIDPLVAEHRGRIFKTTGDGLMVEFPSVVDAVRCAVALQGSVEEHAAGASEGRRLRLRVGVNLGDVIVERDDVFGDGVNVAARLEGLAEPGGVCVSQAVREMARGIDAIDFEDRGEISVKNVARPIRVFGVVAREPSPRPAPPRSGKSIAVLPFANLSRDPDNEYFSEGITEEILTVLCRVRDLRVISRQSVMRYKGSTKDIRTIAEELGVAHVLEGSARRAGSRVRVTAQLIDARADAHLWAESYDRDLGDVFAIQSELAGGIVASLEAVLTPEERTRMETRSTENMEAWEWNLKGRHLAAQRTEAGLRAAIVAFRKAVAADPGYARAWSGLADALVILCQAGTASPDVNLPEARAAAARAVALDPGLGEAHASLGLATHMDRSLPEAERSYVRAIELAPSYAPAHHWYGNLLMHLGRQDEAVAMLEHALALDPLSAPVRNALGVAVWAGRDFEGAIRIFREGLELDPEFEPYYDNLVGTLLALGRYEEALEAEERVSRLHPAERPADYVASLRRGYESGGEPGYWQANVDWEMAHENAWMRDIGLGYSLVRLGRHEEALDAFERAVDRKDLGAWQLLHSPSLEPLAGNPRFEALKRRLLSG